MFHCLQGKCSAVYWWSQLFMNISYDLQVFMIPGVIFINVLAGSLFGLWGSFALIACVSTVGAGTNYWLARLLVRVGFPPSVTQSVQ